MVIKVAIFVWAVRAKAEGASQEGLGVERGVHLPSQDLLLRPAGDRPGHEVRPANLQGRHQGYAYPYPSPPPRRVLM